MAPLSHFLRLVCHRADLDQQMRMRQLVHGHGRSRRPVVVEDILRKLRCIQRNRSCLRGRLSLRPHPSRPAPTLCRISRTFSMTAWVCSRMSRRVVPNASTSAPAMELSARRALVPETNRKSPARLTCGYLPRGSRLPRRRTLLSTFPMFRFYQCDNAIPTAECRCCSARNKNSANARRLRVRCRKGPRHQMASADRAGTSNSPR